MVAFLQRIYGGERRESMGPWVEECGAIHGWELSFTSKVVFLENKIMSNLEKSV